MPLTKSWASSKSILICPAAGFGGLTLSIYQGFAAFLNPVLSKAIAQSRL
jgi:hypothetical protein